MDRSQEPQPDAQEEFVSNVRGVKEAARTFASGLKDFERRAGKDPKRCAEEAMRRVASSITDARLLFRKFFSLDLEQRDVWWNKISLPTDPEQRRLFMCLAAQYDLDKGTWAFFEWCVNRPDKPHEGHAQAMCRLYVENELFSPLVWAKATDIVHRQMPQRTRSGALVEMLTGVFVTHISVHRNLRLKAAIDDLRSNDESRYEKLLEELPGAILTVWRRRAAAWKADEPSPEEFDFKGMRNEVTRSLEKRNKPPEILDLAAFADRERLLKLAKAARLGPQELEVFRLYVENPSLKYREIADQLGVSTNQVGVIKHRIKKKLAAGF